MKDPALARSRASREPKKAPLKARRRAAQKALVIALAIAAVLILAGLIALSWQPFLRIDQVTAAGPHAESVEALAEQALWGTHYHIVPRDSLFFLPEDDIRARVLGAHPDIEAISIGTDGLTTLTVSAVPRAEAFIWCGESRGVPQGCWSANAEGFVFAPLAPERASSTEAFRVYAPLAGDASATPLGRSIAATGALSEMLRFVKALQTLGADIAEAALRGDEADLYTDAGTRITYVLGREAAAAETVASVYDQVSLNDGSLEYLDVRFAGKAYFRRADIQPGVEEPIAE